MVWLCCEFFKLVLLFNDGIAFYVYLFVIIICISIISYLNGITFCLAIVLHNVSPLRVSLPAYGVEKPFVVVMSDT